MSSPEDPRLLRVRRALVEEIAKCEVVCANCHRRRTYTREKSVRSRWGGARGDEPRDQP